MKNIKINHNKAGENQKPHFFKIDRKKTVKKGQMTKSKNGLYMIVNKDNYVYHCAKCDSTIELDKSINEHSLNIQVAQRYSCI